MPYVDTTLGGSASGALLPPRRTQREDGGIDPLQRRRDQGDVRDLSGPPGRFDRLRLESGHDEEGGPGDDRAGHDGQPADVRQRQAGEPCVPARVDAERVPRSPWPTPRWRHASARRPSAGPTCPTWRRPGRRPPRRGAPSAERVLLAVGTDDPRGAEGVEHRRCARRGGAAGRAERPRRRCPRWPAAHRQTPSPPGRSSATSSGTGQ